MRILSAILTLTVMVSAGTSSFAQKVKKDGLGYFNYFQPRESKDLDEAEYYSLDTEFGDYSGYNSKLVESGFVPNVFKITGNEEQADFKIQVEGTALKFNSAEKKSRQESYKDNGVQRKRTIYQYKGSASYHYTLIISSKDGNEIFRDYYEGSNPFSGGFKRSVSQAHDDYVKEKDQQSEDLLKSALAHFTKVFNERYTNDEKSVHVKIHEIVEKKYDYPNSNEGFEKLKSAYSFLTSDVRDENEAMLLCDQAIDLYKVLLKESDPENKKAKVNADVTSAIYYNIGLAHFFKGEYQLALDSFNESSMYDKSGYAHKILTDVCGKCADLAANLEK